MALWRHRDRSDDLSSWPHQALLALHDELVAESATRDEDSAVGAMATIGCLDIGRLQLHVAHLGSSRLYQLRAGATIQLTNDHTVGAELEANGMSRDEILANPVRCVSLRCLGGLGGAHDIDTFSVDLESGDRLVFVSHEMDVCSKSELAAILSRFTNPRVAAAELVAAAEGHEPAPFDRGATALVVSFR